MTSTEIRARKVNEYVCEQQNNVCHLCVWFVPVWLFTYFANIKLSSLICSYLLRTVVYWKTLEHWLSGRCECELECALIGACYTESSSILAMSACVRGVFTSFSASFSFSFMALSMLVSSSLPSSPAFLSSSRRSRSTSR